MIYNNLTTVDREVLNTIRQHGSLSKIRLSRIRDISVTSSGNLIKKLNKYDILEQIDGRSTGGRKPALYKLKDDLFYAMGIEIDFQSIHIIITDANNNIIISKKNMEPFKEVRELDLGDVVKLGEATLKSIEFSWENISVIGIGIIGIVDEKNGICRLLPNAPKWQNLNIVKNLKQRTGVENVFLTDVVRAMALFESKFGSGREFSDFVLIYLGTGLGAGIVLDKRVITGANGISGEFGHIKVSQGKGICVCGNYGCLESIASGWAIINNAKEAIANGVYTSMTNLLSSKDDLVLSDVIDSALNGDKLALNIINNASDYISSGISTIINLLDPEVIILTGEMATRGKNILVNSLINKIKAISFPWLTENINIRVSEIGENIGVLGLSSYAIDLSFDEIISKIGLESYSV